MLAHHSVIAHDLHPFTHSYLITHNETIHIMKFIYEKCDESACLFHDENNTGGLAFDYERTKQYNENTNENITKSE